MGYMQETEMTKKQFHHHKVHLNKNSRKPQLWSSLHSLQPAQQSEKSQLNLHYAAEIAGLLPLQFTPLCAARKSPWTVFQVCVLLYLLSLVGLLLPLQDNG